ncbi:MAG TPA: M56 family metallopeptidase, partial [Planctomycetaceae bacterium]|nr:M56 family metallopeptidase [Planctomycetaceae bacterium]
EPVIAHELIHLRRRDPLAAWLQLVAVCWNWWNPLVWWASRSATRSREDCCDQEVLGSFRFPPEKYAQALIEVLRNKRSRPAPLAIAALPLTQHRIENIMKRHKSFLARSPRWCWMVILLLAIAVLPAGSPADDRQNSAPITAIPVSALAEPAKADATAEEEPAMEVPQLLYLAWSQKEDDKTKPRVLWTPEGRVVSEADVAEPIAKHLGLEVREQEGYPQLESLTLFFDVDGRLTYSPIFPTVRAEGKRAGRYFALNSPEKGLSFSSVSLLKSDFEKWPEKISLELKYPLENLTVINTIKEIPDEPIDIAEGITWYLDPNRASIFDRETNRLIRVENKSAAVLQIRMGRPDELTAYSVRVYLRDQERPVQENYVTIIEPDGHRHEIRVSNPVDPAEIERIEVVRQRHDIRLIRDLPIKVDLIPKPE